MLKQVKDNLKHSINDLVKDANIQNKVVKRIVRATLKAIIDKLITLLEGAYATSDSMTQAKYIIATLAILLCPEPENHDEIKKLTDEFTIQANVQIGIK